MSSRSISKAGRSRSRSANGRTPSKPRVPGSQIFDTEHNWSLISACVREVLAATDADAVRAVAATSMREGMVLYDARGHEIWACPNVDSRAATEAGELIRSGAAQEIYEIGGDWVSITAPARFRWLATHEPETFSAIAHVGMLGDWILTRLCGEFTTDPSLGSSSGMFDLATRTWSERLIEVVGLEPSMFPPVREPGEVVGAVTPEAASDTGLRQGTPCVVGGADTQLGLVGIGVARPGAIHRRRRLVLAADCRPRRAVDRPARTSPDALPRNG